MGQIVGWAAKPKRCNLNKLSQLSTPAAGEHILVSSDNSMNAAGQGNFDCYIVGDGKTAATALPLIKTYANDVDDEPTSGSDKLVKSGKMYEKFSQLGYEKIAVSAHKNLYDYNSITEGKYINASGGFSDNAGFFVSSFIPVKSATQYYISRGTNDKAVGSAGSYFAEYDSSFNLVALTAANNKTITTNSATRFLRISGYGGYKLSAMVSEGASYVPYEEYSPINYPIYLDQFHEVDLAKKLNSPDFFQVFNGADNAIVTKKVYLASGRTYRLFFDNKNWAVTNVTSSASNKLFVQKVIEGESPLSVITVSRDMTIPDLVTFVSESADYYTINIRANVGETVNAFLVDVTEANLSPAITDSVAIIYSTLGRANFDTRTKVLNLGTDSVVFVGDKYYTLGNDSQYQNISFGISSSLRKLLFNVSTKVFRFAAYSATQSSSEVFVGAMRVYKDGIVNSFFPFDYTIDGFMPHEYLNQNNATFVGVSRQKFMRNVNHQGYNAIAPNNTLPAFRLSRKYGFDYCETDIRFTSDGYPVLLHDDTVDATSSGTGRIDEMTLSDARALDFGSWKNAIYAGTQIPTFEEFLSLCKQIQLRPYIEIKAGTEAQIKSLAQTVLRYGMQDVATFICQRFDWLGYIKDVSSKIRLGMIVYGDVLDTHITTAESLKSADNEVFIDAQYTTLTTEGIERCSTAGIPLEIWIVNGNTIKTLDPYITGATSNVDVASLTTYVANMGNIWGINS